MFGVCPSGFLVALRFCFSLMHLLSLLLSFLTHPSLEQPPTPAPPQLEVVGLQPCSQAVSPLRVPDPGKTQSGDQCRGIGVWMGALQHRRLQAASLGQGPPATSAAPLARRRSAPLCTCLQFSSRGEVQTTSESRELLSP